MDMTETMKRWRGRAFGAKGGASTGRTVLKRGAVALGLVLSALCVGRAMGQVIPDADMVAIPVFNFRLQRTEVTQRQWEAVMGSNPSKFRGPDRPVENISWNDCQEFIKRASEMDGRQYRLPTETEWEWACRAYNFTGDWGKRANGECGPLDAMGWYEKNSGGETHPVAQKEPNAWGLYDMHGNVWEWCQDESGDSDLVYRGGSWSNDVRYCSASCRASKTTSFKLNRIFFRRGDLGFRLALD